MADQAVDDVVESIQQIKSSLQAATQSLAGCGLAVRRAEIELKTTFERDLGGSVNIKVVEIGADVSRSDVQTISISLTPVPPGPKLSLDAANLSDEIARAVPLIARAANEAALASPKFELDEAVVSISVAKALDGKFKVFFGPEAKRETAHTITLTLGSA